MLNLLVFARGLVCFLAFAITWSPFACAKPFWGSNDAFARNHGPRRRAKQANYNYNITRYNCSSHAPKITAPKSNLWAPLTDAETAWVVQWLFQQKDLNLTAAAMASTWANTIDNTEILVPNKSVALSYLDGSSPEPARYAKVSLALSATEDAVYQEIRVGPLPIATTSNITTSNTTVKWHPLDWTFTRNPNGQVRNLGADQNSIYGVWLVALADSVADITTDLFGSGKGNISVWGTDPLIQDGGRVVRWDAFWRESLDFFNTDSMLPLGLYARSDTTGRDLSKWKVTGWFYNNIFYESTDAFRKAYWTPGFEKLGAEFEGDWGRTDQQGTPLPMDDKDPPSATSPSSPRFGVDVDQSYIEWMGFSFYIGFGRDVGLTLYDIRYNGTRILYELGMQEALSHYAGNDPFLSASAYFDSFYGFGEYSFELIPGYDCPQGATYLDSSFFLSDTLVIHPNSICLFEFDADYAMQRHTTSQYVSIAKNTQFAIRTVATVGNYDYTITYTFSLDGSIEVGLKASGYIEAGHYAYSEDYGFRIHDFLNGAMHDHVLNFKADFDVLGTANTVELISNRPLSKVYPWSDGKVRNTMALNRSFINNEDQGRFNWADNSATQVIVVNKDKPNKFGEYPGWRIIPTTPGAHLTVQDSSTLVNAGRWAEFDIQITRRKDTEPRSVHVYNNMDTFNPPVDFSKFFNSESLEQEDLVVWLNIGMHHVPHTGDLPNTVMTSAYAGIKFVPSNYFASDPSIRSRSRVRVNYNNGVVTERKIPGRENDVCLKDFGLYTGDLNVNLNPFDPEHPFFSTSSV